MILTGRIIAVTLNPQTITVEFSESETSLIENVGVTVKIAAPEPESHVNENETR